MLLAAQICVDFAAHNSYEAFLEDKLRRQGLLKAIQNIGEAAAHITDTTRRRLSGVPWVDIVALRHRLVHDYNRIDAEAIWETIQRDLPELIAVLQPLGLESTD